jgi:hypothetical protein
MNAAKTVDFARECYDRALLLIDPIVNQMTLVLLGTSVSIFGMAGPFCVADRSLTQPQPIVSRLSANLGGFRNLIIVQDGPLLSWGAISPIRGSMEERRSKQLNLLWRQSARAKSWPRCRKHRNRLNISCAGRARKSGEKNSPPTRRLLR